MCKPCDLADFWHMHTVVLVNILWWILPAPEKEQEWIREDFPDESENFMRRWESENIYPNLFGVLQCNAAAWIQLFG